MKHFYLPFLVTALLTFSCTTDELSSPESTLQTETAATAKTATQVKLIKHWNAYGNYRGFSKYTKKFVVEVSNLSPTKKVSVLHEKLDGSWGQIDLAYDFSIDAHREIWKGAVIVEGFGEEAIYGSEFAIKYEVNGITYWDNNNDSNYNFKNQGWTFAVPNLNVSVNEAHSQVVVNPNSEQSNFFTVVADVKNIDYSKTVTVVYSTDAWKTEKTFDLNYEKFWRQDNWITVASPNASNVETWKGVIDLDKSVDKVSFKVKYKVDQQEYVDDNYGLNYTVVKNP